MLDINTGIYPLHVGHPHTHSFWLQQLWLVDTTHTSWLLCKVRDAMATGGFIACAP